MRKNRKNKQNNDVTLESLPLDNEVINDNFALDRVPPVLEDNVERDYFTEYYNAYKNDYITQYLEAYKSLKQKKAQTTVQEDID